MANSHTRMRTEEKGEPESHRESTAGSDHAAREGAIH